MEPNRQMIIHGCKVDYKRIHIKTYGQCQKPLWNPMKPYKYLWNKMDIINKLHGIKWTHLEYN
jgi:hypothetical protein